ncbi:MAG: cobalt ECF transporter T component CbiQ [Anaerolineae bacterium]|nr:cobalt ECF transporter T component CbiQ [Anaerolineae bacterium]
MHIHFQDPYRAGVSAVHRLDARVKFVLALAFILMVASAPVGAWPIYVLLLSLTLSAAIAAEVGVGFLLRRAALALPFALAALTVIFTTTGPAWLRLPLGPWTVTITYPGLERFASIAVKSWLSVQAAILLSATTEFPALLLAMRAVKVPRLLVAIFGLMWRYLFVLADEARRLMQAREARSADTDGRGGGSVAWRGRVTGGMVGNLFLRGIERGERIYAAMAARGYDGEVRAFPLPRLGGGSLLVLVAGLLLCLSLAILAQLVW